MAHKYSAEQTKRQSMIEASLNVFSGMVIAFTISQLAHWFEPQIQKYLWKGFEWNLSVGSNAIMTTLFTVISVVRGYAWRRYFNKATKETSQGLLQQRRAGSLFKYEEKI